MEPLAPRTRRGHFRGDREAPVRASLLGLRGSRNPVVRGSKRPGEPEVGDGLAHFRYFSLRKLRCPLLPGVLVATCDPGSGRNQGWNGQGLPKPLPNGGRRRIPRGPGRRAKVLSALGAQSAPFCMRCGITKPYRILVLTCTVTGSALLWWAFSLSTWARVDIPDGPRVLFSALFAICSDEVRCWVPPSKSYCFIFGRIFMISALLLSFFLNITLLAFPNSLPDTWKQYFVFTITCFIIGVCVFLTLLLHSLYIWRVTDVFKEAKVTFLYPTFILSVSITLFFLSGILCFISAHHCWFRWVLQRPIQVEPMQTSMASHCPVTDTESKPSADS